MKVQDIVIAGQYIGCYSASSDVTNQLTKHYLCFSKPMTGVLRLKNIHGKV